MIINSNGYNELGGRMTLLWSNTSPESAFEKQSIVIDSYRYKLLYIMFFTAVEDLKLNTALYVTDSDSGINYLSRALDGMDYKRIYSVTATGISFELGKKEVYSNNGKLSTSSGAEYIIPYKIYGVY